MSDDVLARALTAHQQGRLADAEHGYRVVLARAPRHTDALYLLGVLLHQSGRSRDALAPLRELTSTTLRVDALNTLGDAHRVLGELAEARTVLERALAAAPNDAAVQTNLALTLSALGAKQEALVLLFTSVAKNPSHAGLRQLLAASLNGVVLGSGDAMVHAVLCQLAADPTIATQSIAGAILGLVCNSDAFRQVRATVERHEDPFETAPHAVRKLLADTLLIAAMPRMLVADAAAEMVLTAVRQHALVRGPSGADDGIPLAWIAALASQCFNTEYAWTVTNAEWDRVLELRGAVDAQLDTGRAVDERTLAMLACYHSLAVLAGSEALAQRPIDSWSESMRPVIVAQVMNAKDERDRAAAMPALTLSSDAVSRHVRAMHETNPYPRWIMAQRPPEVTVAALLTSLRADADVQAMAGRRARVLVAGCGTGQQPVHLALTHRDADILAFDLSRASLAYGARMADALDVRNVRFAWGDLLELADEGGRFDLIACSGVLHHLGDPMAGWRRLLARLAPRGVMKIGLYSALARASIDAARELVRERRLSTDDDGLRAGRQLLLGLPDGHPASSVRGYLDFYALSGVRDLLFHVQERTYTVTDIAAALDTLNLRFLGFQLPHAVQVQFQSEFPQPHAMLELAAWEQFETRHPATFRAMYQFWCCPC
jgi:SAM-dependent methyltransferase/tetratricopeptide (TPR) repeat protein